MKLHLYFNGTISGHLDLESILPVLIDKYPKSRVELKAPYAASKFIQIEKPIENVILIQLNEDIDCKIETSFTLNIYEAIGYLYLDITLYIDKELLLIILNRNLHLTNAIIGKGKIKDGDEIKDASSFLIPLMINGIYTNATLSENLEPKLSTISDELNDFTKNTHVKPILGGLELSLDPMINPCTYSLIEDFEDEIEINSYWKDISYIKNTLFEDVNSEIRLLRDKNLLDSVKDMNYFGNNKADFLFKSYKMCEHWFFIINNEISNIRENISTENSNPYYWKQLKNKNEILDLNFLEFNTYIMKHIDLLPGHPTRLRIKEDYRNNSKKVQKDRIDMLFKYIDQVKSALMNLSTPGHSHDEMFLQEETEKVNDRILMLSFIAMSIPSIGAILAPGISNFIKIMAGCGIFLLPVIYILIRGIIKKIRFNKNKKMDTSRIISNLEVKLDYDLKNLAEIKNNKNMPKDFQEGIISFLGESIEKYKDDINSLKKKP